MQTWVHSIDPFAIQISENFGIRWYGLAYLSAFLGTYLSIRVMFSRQTTSLSIPQMSEYVTYGAVGALLGGRLGYACFYAPYLFVNFSSEFPYWGLLSVHKGGMASHGGLIGVVLACCIFSRVHKINILHLFDLSVFGASIGFCLGRIANFINGELYGRIAPTSFKWAVKFPSEIYLWTFGDKAKLEKLTPALEALGPVSGPDGKILQFTSSLWSQWIGRFDSLAHRNISFFKEKLVQATQTGNEMVIEALAPALSPRYPSQLMQSFLEGFLVFIILTVLWSKPRKPGFIGASFALLYSTARVLGEQYRMPDAHIGFDLWGFTRGQWLSITLFLFGVCLMVYSLKKKSTPTGGWNLF